MAGEDIRIGVVVTLVGPYASLGEDSLRGVQQAVAQFDGQIGARKIVPVTESSSGIPASATEAVSKLLDKHQVAFTIGPLTGSEGLALRDYAKNRSDRVFLNGNAAAQDMTLRDPARTFSVFLPTGSSGWWVAGICSELSRVVSRWSGVAITPGLWLLCEFPGSAVGVETDRLRSFR